MSPSLRRLARRASAAAAVVVVALLGVTASPAQADYALLQGDGSTWSKGIFDQWISDVSRSGIQVVYTATGSSAGRKSFANFQDDFAISEIPYQGTDESNQQDSSPNRPYAYLPMVAGGTAFTYHVEVGGKLMRDVRLSGSTIAKIFTNAITNWNDPAIAADNNGRQFPDLPVVPVVRSDGSGTTAQFTTWLDKQQPDVWRPYLGRAGLTSTYPVKSGTKMLAAPGSDQVMNSIAAGSGNGTIGYVEYSYALNKKYPVVKVLNAAGYYVEPKDTNVAVALTKARINTDKGSQNYLTQILDDVYTNPDPRTYPLSSYSYMILPTGQSGKAAGQDSRMTTAKRQTLVDFMSYSLCQGQKQAGPYGYSPMPLNLVQAGFEQIAKLKEADPAVDLQNRDVTTCGNPTFVAGDLNRNYLAETAPMPKDCDKQGAGPCLTASSGGVKSSTTKGSGTKAGTGSGTGTTGGDAAAGGDQGGAATVVDPETGEVVTADDTSGEGDGLVVSDAVATVVPARAAGTGPVFGVLTALELLALVLVPGLLAVRARRKRATP